MASRGATAPAGFPGAAGPSDRLGGRDARLAGSNAGASHSQRHGGTSTGPAGEGMEVDPPPVRAATADDIAGLPDAPRFFIYAPKEIAANPHFRAAIAEVVGERLGERGAGFPGGGPQSTVPEGEDLRAAVARAVAEETARLRAEMRHGVGEAVAAELRRLGVSPAGRGDELVERVDRLEDAVGRLEDAMVRVNELADGEEGRVQAAASGMISETAAELRAELTAETDRRFDDAEGKRRKMRDRIAEKLGELEDGIGELRQAVVEIRGLLPPPAADSSAEGEHISDDDDPDDGGPPSPPPPVASSEDERRPPSPSTSDPGPAPKRPRGRPPKDPAPHGTPGTTRKLPWPALAAPQYKSPVNIIRDDLRAFYGDRRSAMDKALRLLVSGTNEYSRVNQKAIKFNKDHRVQSATGGKSMSKILAVHEADFLAEVRLSVPKLWEQPDDDDAARSAQREGSPSPAPKPRRRKDPVADEFARNKDAGVITPSRTRRLDRPDYAAQAYIRKIEEAIKSESEEDSGEEDGMGEGAEVLARKADGAGAPDDEDRGEEAAREEGMEVDTAEEGEIRQ